MTDAHYEQRIAEGCVGVDPDFARQLERELKEAREETAMATKQIEECVAAMRSNSRTYQTQRAALEKARKAGKNFLNSYLRLVNSGDAGFWDPETEPEIIAMRAALTTINAALKATR